MLFLVLSTAFFICGLVIVYWLHNQYHLDILVEPVGPPTNAPLISICVPVRNEERNIRACVESLLAQDYPDFEVIVLEDRSTDGTPDVLRQLAMESVSQLHSQGVLSKHARTQKRAPELHIISGAELPAGWTGKPHALYQASAAARGDWLCFVDADTFLSPATLSSCYAKALETKADMFTIMTFQILGSFWEKVVMPLVMTALSTGFSPRKVNDPSRKDAIANGQFILIKRPVYEAIGGHESVKDQIVEDKAISEQVKWNGYRLIVADGMKVARTRMYTSLPEMWEGWTKNIYLGLRDRSSLLLLGVFGGLIALIAAFFLPLWPFLGLFWLLHNGGRMAEVMILESLILWTAVIFARAQIGQKMEISPWYAFTTPLGAALFAAMMLTSTVRVISGRGVLWKGRRYAPK
jgi:chlorobactene glucosyltransferase